MSWHSLPLCFALALCAGCVGELTLDEPGLGGGRGGGGPDAGVANTAARQYFDTDVQPLLHLARPKGACSACHQGAAPGGPGFMGQTAADNYALLSSNARLVGDSPATSVLITYGDHSGDAFCTGAGTPYAACTTNEVQVISEWINLEASP